MKDLIKITLSISLLATLSQAKVYEDAEDGNTQGWRVYDNTPSGATISNIKDNGNRVIKLSGDITRNAYIIGGTSKIPDKPYKWDAREGSKLSFKIKFDLGQRPEILVAIRPAHQSDKIRYIRYRSATRHDENGWNRSGSILSIKLDETLENGEWLSITRDLEKDLQAYRHPFDPTKNRIVAVNGMIIYGSALVDDIQIERSHETLTIRKPLIPANCKGEIVKKGLDLNDNGVLEDNEVTSTNENYTEGTPITRTELEEMIDNDEDVTQVNTCKITDMSYLFDRKFLFERDLSEWSNDELNQDTDSFRKYFSFNQDISSWNTGSVTNMEGMFSDAVDFNQPIGNWDVSKVTNMKNMFGHWKKYRPENISALGYQDLMYTLEVIGSHAFNQALGDWNVSNVKEISGMFGGANHFNQPLGKWDVSNVSNMSYMFAFASSFQQPLRDWNVSNVTNMTAMFKATNFNQPIGNWDVSSVTNISEMFSGLDDSYHDITYTTFNQDLNDWDLSNVTDMHSMFLGAISFNQPINNWNVANVIDMNRMFLSATTFNQPINNWNVSNVENMNFMFYEASNFKNHDLTEWDVDRVEKHRDFITNAGSGNIKPLWN